MADVESPPFLKSDIFHVKQRAWNSCHIPTFVHVVNSMNPEEWPQIDSRRYWKIEADDQKKHDVQLVGGGSLPCQPFNDKMPSKWVNTSGGSRTATNSFSSIINGGPSTIWTTARICCIRLMGLRLGDGAGAWSTANCGFW